MDEKFTIFTLIGHQNCRADINQKLNKAVTVITGSNESCKFSLEETPKPNPRESKQNKRISSYVDQSKPIKSPLIVVAIDFGTSYTGYAFVFKNDKDQIHYMKKNFGKQLWFRNRNINKCMFFSGLDDHSKVPTTLLLDYRKEFHSFGYEAKSNFYNLDCRTTSKYYYFENFKMNLYHEMKQGPKFKLNPLNHPECGMDALKIFTISIEHLCSQALKEIGDQCALTLDREDIGWVITVPTIWSETSKQFMRKAAENSSHICGETLRIALEPEVASLYCRKFLSEEYRLKEERSNDDAVLDKGYSYLLVDFGGGTVDITAHQIQTNGFIKEIHKSTGGPFGSNEINKQFEEILSSIFGRKLWRKFKKETPSTFLDLMQTFEIRKREARPDRHTAYNILLTYSFIKFFSSSLIEELFDKAPSGLAFSTKLGIIRIDAPLMRKMFRKVIEPTIQIIQSLLDGPLASNRISFIFLVGGFAQSSILKQEIRLAFEPKYPVIVPHQAHLAVLYGACQYGLNPTLIQSRRSMKTYGIAVLVKFDTSIHPKHKRITKDGLQWCSDVFDKFVTINQSIGMYESVKKMFKPILPNQTSCIFQIYSTENDCARFVTDADVSKCGTLYLELDVLHCGEHVNPAIKQLIQREIEVEMFFGETEIKVSAKDLQTGYSVKSNVDFLSKIE